MPEKLKPCPFCGRDPILRDEAYERGYRAFAQCCECLASRGTHIADSRQIAISDAIAAWNRRAPDPRIERARAEIEIAQHAILGLHLAAAKDHLSKALAALDKEVTP